MHKFYTLEDLTQEDLNKLSLERNTLDSNWNELKKWLESLYTKTQDDKDCQYYLYVLKKLQELEGNNE